MQNIRLLRKLLDSKKLSAVELAQDTLTELKKNPFGAVLALNEKSTFEQAKSAQKKIDKGSKYSTLGIPVIHKDILVTKNWITTAGSKILENYISPFDATVVERLENSGLVCMGKASCDEFAMGSANQNCAYGKCVNPWEKIAIPGGSSGGSAALVAGGVVPVATGTDTGGSIRQPAAMCGVTGLKPTYGRISRWGLIAYASSLDQAGPIASNAYDCGLLMNSMAGFDHKDSTSINLPKEDFCRLMDENTRYSSSKILEKITLGLPKEYFNYGVSNEVLISVEKAVKKFQSLGAKVKEVSLPNTRFSVAAYYVIAPAEASSNLSRFDGVRFGYRADKISNLEEMYYESRTRGFGEEVKRRILVGTFVLSHGYYDAYYVQALKVRRLIVSDFENAFKECDFIVSPTSPSVAWNCNGVPNLCDEDSQSIDVPKEYLSDIFTVGVSLAGLPAISIPCGFGQNQNSARPVGLQIIGERFSEAKILQIADIYQNETNWHNLTPQNKD